jgi:hypothetical protein
MGQENRAISDYYFQPAAKIAFTNTIYSKTTLEKLTAVTPTSLTQVQPGVRVSVRIKGYGQETVLKVSVRG